MRKCPVRDRAGNATKFAVPTSRMGGFLWARWIQRMLQTPVANWMFMARSASSAIKFQTNRQPTFRLTSVY
jgi:hypothetical protein